ncbi:MAG: tRNA uridine-5-carboxymethylaminomethyl(34) synthesis GTPase MnmE, partial [Gemmatimonadetes bacterium]|nr:tRNA uridine-5-carboxymethylaminomethyl(34) synthesis GTPase MnmE [Gemmatimonadota bacterium]
MIDSGDTIAAISTAPGRSGVALVRVSGPRARAVAASIGAETGSPRVSRLATVRGTDGGAVDRALITWFEAPSSFTGEDVVELSCHGGALVPALVLDALCAAGARVAEPGEFTKRAYLNGKLDLIQAEATLDLIDATSPAQGASAMAQLRGRLSGRVDELRRELLELQAALGYDIDFPEEDDGPIGSDRILATAGRTAREISALLEHASEGERLRTGALVVIAGAPNVGKSSLFNA